MGSLIETISIDGHFEATVFLEDRGVVEYRMDVPGLDKALMIGFILAPIMYVEDEPRITLYDKFFKDPVLKHWEITEEKIDQYYSNKYEE